MLPLLAHFGHDGDGMRPVDDGGIVYVCSPRRVLCCVPRLICRLPEVCGPGGLSGVPGCCHEIWYHHGPTWCLHEVLLRSQHRARTKRHINPHDGCTFYFPLFASYRNRSCHFREIFNMDGSSSAAMRLCNSFWKRQVRHQDLQGLGTVLLVFKQHSKPFYPNLILRVLNYFYSQNQYL